MADTPELFDTSGVRDDDAHWDALSAQIAGRATRDSGGRLEWFARGPAGLVAASLVLAAALAAAVIPSRSAAGAGVVADIAAALGPSDMVGQSLTAPNEPPPIGTLLLGAGSRGAQ